MFGQNNNLTADNNPAVPAPPMPNNPFGGSDMPAPNPSMPDPLASMPSAPPIATPSTPPVSGAPAGDLLNLKQQALQSLQPLVSHLDQQPEEKFKTTMMLIQASDNPELVRQAYETANQITDEKARAQALLDVVNEINYFTHKDDKPEA